MTTDPKDNAKSTPEALQLLEKARQGLQRFFQNPYIKNSVDVLVSGVLAAVLFPIFGPALATPVAAVAVHNGLAKLHISFSANTIDKLLQSLEGKPIEETELISAFQEILPKDKQANDESAKALVTMVPEVKEAALQNKRLDQEWLGKGLASGLTQQGETMAKIAPQVQDLIQLDQSELLQARNHLLASWSQILQEITATEGGEVSDAEQTIKGNREGNMAQKMTATKQGKITGAKQTIE